MENKKSKIAQVKSLGGGVPLITSEAKKRKETPIYSGFISYFPNAIEEVARLSFVGNEQHNKGEPLHWARGKSTDHLDCAMRHLTDHAKGIIFDTDGQRHLTKAGWRIFAQLQLDLEK